MNDNYYIKGFMSKCAEFGIPRAIALLAARRLANSRGGLEKTAAGPSILSLIGLGRSLFPKNIRPVGKSVIQSISSSLRNGGTSKASNFVRRMMARRSVPYQISPDLPELAHTQGEAREILEDILGPRIDMGQFLTENPYNGFTVYKGGVHRHYKPFTRFVDRYGNVDVNPFIFSSGRPTVGLDYHYRPTGFSNEPGLPMFATGDVRRSPMFLNGDRFFTPQSASVDLQRQIEAARQGMGTQRYYGTGYHYSSDFPDFEITLPNNEFANVLDKYYVVEPTVRIRDYLPFGQIAEHAQELSDMRNLPFTFRPVKDPDTFVRIKKHLPRDLFDKKTGPAWDPADMHVGKTRPSVRPPAPTAQRAPSPQNYPPHTKKLFNIFPLHAFHSVPYTTFNQVMNKIIPNASGSDLASLFHFYRLGGGIALPNHIINAIMNYGVPATI